VHIEFVPFVPGWRPWHETTHPGLGSSEDVAVILPGDERDRAHLLYELDGDATVRATVSFTGPDGTREPVPVPGFEDLEVEPSIVGRRRMFVLAPDDLLTGADAFTFAQRFSQQVLVELRALDGDAGAARARASLLVCDLRRSGSLYARLLERLVAPDAARQAAATGVEDPGAAYHPWYPVLEIGADKAALYTRALVQDIAGAGAHLSDPGWLMRVGLFLEFLTFLGICEAVKDDAGDLLEPAERAAFADDDAFAAIRAAIDPEAWREVWALRRIQFPRRGAPRTGPVSGSRAATTTTRRRRGSGCSATPSEPCSATSPRRSRSSSRSPRPRATSSSGTAAASSSSGAGSVCQARSAPCSPTRTGCTHRRARSTGTR
jgi:hypothetical protein